jgi:hypothetical protein
MRAGEPPPLPLIPSQPFASAKRINGGAVRAARPGRPQAPPRAGHLAAWIITRLQGQDAAEGALHYVAPVGEKEEYIERAWRNITPYLPAPAPALV